MRHLRQLSWPLAVACAFLASSAFAASKEKSEPKSDETSVGTKEGEYKSHDDKQKDKRKTDSKTAKAVKYHIKNLKDPDPEVRQSSCEMLAILGSPYSVEALIDVLRPDRKEPLMVMLSANGALSKITGKNFGYKEYDQWMSWWAKEKDEFLKKAETGIDARAKIAAEASNQTGRGFMDLGEYKQAQAFFLDAVNRDPTVPDYRNNLGLSLLEQARYLDAMEYFQEVIGLDADLPQPYMNIGRCYSRMNKSIEAESWYKKANERDKDGKLWDLNWMVGKEYMKRAEWTLAFEYLDQARAKAEKLNVRDPRMYNDLAITHYGMDQYHSAWKELTNVRTLGFEPNASFVAKVRKALVDAGIDPDAEDKKAREVLRNDGDPDAGAETANP